MTDPEEKQEQEGVIAAVAESGNDGPPAEEEKDASAGQPEADNGGAEESSVVNAETIADSDGKVDAPSKDDNGETRPVADAAKDDGKNEKEGASEGGVGEKRKEMDSKQKLVLPQKIPKKARTAYFMFADEKRAEIQAAHPGETVGVIAKRIGQMWGDLTDADKKVYQDRAAEEKKRVAEQMEALREAGLLPDPATLSSTAAGSAGSTGFTLPVARIRKICKLDPEVRGLSKESVHCITKAAELFTANLGREAVAVAAMQNRRKIIPEDIVEVCSTKEEFVFLQNDVKDLMKEQKETQQEKAAASGGDSKSKKADAAVSGVQPLTSYFGANTTTSAYSMQENKVN